MDMDYNTIRQGHAGNTHIYIYIWQEFKSQKNVGNIVISSNTKLYIAYNPLENSLLFQTTVRTSLWVNSRYFRYPEHELHIYPWYI